MKRIQRQSDQIVIGMPSKGRLKEHVLAFLASKGLGVKPPVGRELQSQINTLPNHKVVFLHPKDIPLLIEKNVIDVGFSGLDLMKETKANIRPVVRLNLGHVKMAIMVPNDSEWYHPFHLLDRKVATPFPQIAQEYFDRLKMRVDITAIGGASEGMPYLGIVDAIVDVVETGTSAEENNLKVIANDLFDSECICAVNKPEFQSNYQLVNSFLRRIY